MSSTVNEVILERAYEILEVICDDPSMEDVALRMNKALEQSNLTELYWIIKTEF